MYLQAMLIPVILEMSSMLLNSEAFRVSFLNQTLFQIENCIKMDNLAWGEYSQYSDDLDDRRIF